MHPNKYQNENKSVNTCHRLSKSYARTAINALYGPRVANRWCVLSLKSLVRSTSRVFLALITKGQHKQKH